MRAADPPVYIIDGTCFCLVCASEVITVALYRLGLAVKRVLAAPGEQEGS